MTHNSESDKQHTKYAQKRKRQQQQRRKRLLRSVQSIQNPEYISINYLQFEFVEGVIKRNKKYESKSIKVGWLRSGNNVYVHEARNVQRMNSTDKKQW
jgi:hypothetical protein